eukprot:43068_1
MSLEPLQSHHVDARRDLFEMIMTMILSVWNGIMFILFAIKLLRINHNDRYFSKPVLLCAFINFGGWCLCYGIHSVMRTVYLFGVQLSDFTIAISDIIFTALYSISFVSSYLFDISMIYCAFSESTFAINKCTLRLYLFLTTILFSLCFVGTYLMYVQHNKWGEMLQFILYILYIVGLVSVYCNLNMKLIQMVMLENQRSKMYVFTESQSSYMSTITRLSVLQGIFVFAAIAYLPIVLLHHVFIGTRATYIAEWFMYELVVILGTLSIYLTFKMNAKEYRFCCAICDKWCSKCCVYSVKRLYNTSITEKRMAQLHRRGTVEKDTRGTEVQNGENKASAPKAKVKIEVTVNVHVNQPNADFLGSPASNHADPSIESPASPFMADKSAISPSVYATK